MLEDDDRDAARSQVEQELYVGHCKDIYSNDNEGLLESFELKNDIILFQEMQLVSKTFIGNTKTKQKNKTTL